MSLEFLFGLALLDLLGDVPKALDELAVEIKAFDFRCERVGIVNVCQPKSSIWVVLINETCGHRLTDCVVFVFIHS